jgi:hypothetical protein
MKERRQITVPAFCSTFKTVEYLLCVASAWAAITFILTPTLLKQKPPPFYRALQGAHLDWKLGAVCLIAAFLHFVALRGAPCRVLEEEPCEKCAHRRNVCAALRIAMLLFEVGVWFFLMACYGMLALHGEITLASGLCAIFASSASLATFCLAKERAREYVHESAGKLILG